MEVRKNGMFKRMLDKMKSQYMPTKSGQLKMTFDGTIVLRKLVGDEESYIGIANGEVISYDPEFVMDFPVYLINRPYSEIKVDDIVLVKEGKEAMYGKVIKATATKLDVLCFDGLNVVLNKTRDMLTNGATICVVLNMFGNAFTNTNMNGFNPWMFAFMGEGDGKFDMESMMLMSMMQNNGNMGNLMNNPMMFMLLMGNKDGNKSDFMEKIILLNMMQNGDFNIFGKPVNDTTNIPVKSKATTKNSRTPKKVTDADETIVEE